MAYSQVNNEQLKEIRDALLKGKCSTEKIRARHIVDVIKARFNYTMDESTVRGRFIEMNEPLSGVKATVTKEPEMIKVQEVNTSFNVPEKLKAYIPVKDASYIDRGVDNRLAIHYDSNKHPLTQGKQGTGKTASHEHYALRRQLPFFLYSCHEDFKLNKLFGDKTIENGTVVFKESLFVQAIQNPSVILFDEVNAINNKESFPFHALLQNRELFVKDADNGNGKIYKLHKDCKIGFAQNPKSAKYLGGNVKPSNFLGRCTFLTYPEFTQTDIKKVLKVKFPTLEVKKLNEFVQFYFACLKTIAQGNIPVDISIRQLVSMIELFLAGLPLRESIEDGLSAIMDAASQSQNKEVFLRLAQTIWKELENETECDNICKARGFAQMWWMEGVEYEDFS